MRRGKDIQYLPVVDLSRGAKIGMVADLVIDLEGRSVAAFLLAEEGPRGDARLIPFESIRRVGPDAVTVEDESTVATAQERPDLRALAQSPRTVVGMKVLTEEGRLLGTVSDLMVDDRSGAIEQYEVSGGTLRDLLAGRSYLSAAVPRAVGGEFLVVPEVAASLSHVPPEEGSELSMEALPWYGYEGWSPDLEEIAAEVRVRQEELIVGMRANKTLANEDAGGVLVYEGDIITEETVQAVKSAGKLNLLIHAAGEAAALALSEGTVARYARLAAGRLAGRTVHTPEGEVVVAQGDVITVEVVRRVWTAGVMDQLLESVGSPIDRHGERRAARHRAARGLWDQVSERVAWLTGRR